ncbi:VWA domain-containing protein [Mangrovimonas futianensis]|uniref:VWA domain-containing protein n=1 Tax=Mangrovimonas futianensis TaxID=2895523 RepID=UPI001E31E17D|nr:VWA domain-containing protein [Mangrovimonas futianensis]MCF1421868.1 von Willebrand factor type A domain-containing protein [Mangrovimonas futianensis]
MKAILNTLFVCLVSLQIAAQEMTVSGMIADENGLPLPGVNIVIKGTQEGTQTDFDGKYTIKAQVGDVLVYTYVGYVTTEKKVERQTGFSFAMEPDVQSIDEVVISVLGTKRSLNQITTSSQVIKAEELSQAQNPNLVNSLSGKVSGLQINNGNPNRKQNTRIVLRGNRSVNRNSNTLIVIDGVISSEKELSKINQKNIKNVEILKGANGAALYGAQGGNGVLVVQTKSQGKSKKIKEAPLYIVDGMPIPQNNNSLVESIATDSIHSKVVYDKAEAKKKFGRIAKNGCIVITTQGGNFRISDNESYATIQENNFENVHSSPLSTFSIDVDKAAYSNIRRMINSGYVVEPNAVKIEEMVNYFSYDYPQPTGEHPFSINTEVVETPWNKDSKLIRIGLQGKTIENKNLPPSNLTFLIDVSGSMDSENKLPLLKQAFKLLVNQLREKDKVSIVVYAGAAGMVLEPTSGKFKSKIINALDRLEAGGSTAGGAGITLAYELAQKHFIKGGNNRVILATDGDFNVGASSDNDMKQLIEEKRKSGVFLSVLGFGYGNYKDSKLETLADKGNGNHAYIDNMQEAQKVFGKEFGGTLFTIAKDVKIQIEFNPAKIQAYRLIGYENRMLADEDFIDDTKDAGELGSGHTVTALYEVIPVGVSSKYLRETPDLKYTKPTNVNASNELFTVKFRYKKPDENSSTEMVHVQRDELNTPSVDMKFSAAVALAGMQLRHSKYTNDTSLEDVVALAKAGRGADRDGYRAEFIRLIQTYQGI